MSSTAVQLRSRVPRLAGAAVERARLSVVPRRRVRAARVPFVSLVSLLLLGGVIGLLLFNTSMQQASFTATALEEQATSLSAREQALQMQLDVLRDPQHVAEEARAMGMVPATNPTFLRLSDGKVLGVPAAATPLDGFRIDPLPPHKPAEIDPAPTYVDPPAPTKHPSTQTKDEHGASDGGDGHGDGRKSHKHQQSQKPHQNQQQNQQQNQ